jgi:hypothetical protein
MNWIKIAADMKTDDAMGVISEDCGVARYAAVGLCVNVFGVMANKAQSGDVSQVRDSTIEEWAGWDGKRGRFASAFRKALCTKAGVVRSWERYNGAAIRKSEADIERLRSKRRENVARRSPDERATVGVVSQVDGDVDVTTRVQERVVVTPSPPPPALMDAARSMVAPRGHEALATLLAHVPEPAAWVGILRGYASGLSMDQNRPCDGERLAVAVEEFVAQGKHREPKGPSPKLFGGFVRSARTPVKRHADQQTEAEYKAEQLLAIRRQNVRNRSIRQPERPEPKWAAEIDAMFPDGRTHPTGRAA